MTFSIKIQESYHILRYGPIEDAPWWGKITIKISHLLITLSSALNIIIYSYKVGVDIITSASSKLKMTRTSNSEQL